MKKLEYLVIYFLLVFMKLPILVLPHYFTIKSAYKDFTADKISYCITLCIYKTDLVYIHNYVQCSKILKYKYCY